MEHVANDWPPAKGDYVIGSIDSRIAVVTLASSIEPTEKAAIWGTCKTENLGVEKVVINIISNSNIRYLLLCGGESRGHLSGKSLIALHNNGIDENGRIIGSDGAIPFIENIPENAIIRFQEQVDLIDYTGLTDKKEIYELVDVYSNKNEAYAEEPFVILTGKRKKSCIQHSSSADIILSDEFVIDAENGIICTSDQL
ncbi:Tetrahydromethanopterin S-methyltransferase [Methanosalsum zhilinae DSM 4017]|uniref:Tetrahydromethanopterin S-methyltransferase n=1 Tax=Methanosalsum zhilinae (strain DSM 4017 / NBRC 107636 / OCM 62 / WeN5) TaxID=679901 RepID=F7XKL5_METZD|nr:tetrahydromethanopterin S-methyltransferase subunit A [Methanosalsum zhilinae]AEH60618.1 Tetrahydromethanopterin S-methyltransferase [Methanosalsum zhilinae DSM 4017]